MRIFIDSAVLDDIAYWVDAGVVDGVTTNPTLLKQAGVGDHRDAVRRIAALVAPREVSVQLCASTPASMMVEAQGIAEQIANVVVKVPVISPEGTVHLGVISKLATAGTRVNATACLTVGQAVLAAKAGASYVSIFWGRIGDEGGDPASVVQSVRRLLDDDSSRAEVIVGSIRSPADITAAVLSGTHIVTVPPAILLRWADHRYARATVQQFYADSQAAR
jgi:transaldolase